MSEQGKHDALNNTLQAAPSIAAIIATKILNLDVQTWLGICGIAFIGLQAAYLVWKWRRDAKRERERVMLRMPPPDSDRAAL